MRYYSITLLMLIFTNCACYKEQIKESKSEIVVDFSAVEIEEESLSPLESINKRDTLIIAFQGVDCGEWGGHRETFFLQRNNNNEIRARFIQDSVPCDIIEQDGIGILDDRKRVIVLDTIKTLNSEEEKLIKEFIIRITELNLKGSLTYANVGHIYSIKNTNKTFSIYYWNSACALETGYYNMKTNIFGSL